MTVRRLPETVVNGWCHWEGDGTLSMIAIYTSIITSRLYRARKKPSGSATTQPTASLANRDRTDSKERMLAVPQ